MHKILVTSRDKEVVALTVGSRRMFVRVSDQLDALIADLQHVQATVGGTR